MCSCGGHGLSASAPTTSTAAARAGWRAVDMPSAGLSFSSPGDGTKDLVEFDDFPSYVAFVDPSQPPIKDKDLKVHPSYAKFAAVRRGGTSFSVELMVLDDETLSIFIQVHKRAWAKAPERSTVRVNGHEGIMWTRKTESGGMEAVKTWTAADRLYIAAVTSKIEADFPAEDAKTFLGSIVMHDRP